MKAFSTTALTQAMSTLITEVSGPALAALERPVALAMDVVKFQSVTNVRDLIKALDEFDFEYGQDLAYHYEKAAQATQDAIRWCARIIARENREVREAREKARDYALGTRFHMTAQRKAA